MRAGSKEPSQTGNGETDRRWRAAFAHRRMVDDTKKEGDALIDAESRSRRTDPAAARPLAELLACPSDAGNLLTACARMMPFESGQVIFRQANACEGLYLVVQGQLTRRTDRVDTRITLGLARPGDLVELAAALGDLHHTYSLVAQSGGLLLQLPIDALHRAFESYPPLRMRLLEELAREVSRAYLLCSQSWWGRTRRGPRPPTA